MPDKRGGWNGNDASQERREPIDPLSDLVCKKFVTDPHRKYCLECGYLRREHRAAESEGGEHGS
jgi:hypothetical protein